MEAFKNRLLLFIEDHCKLSIRAFEERCGLTNGSIASIRIKGPSADIVSKISYSFPELNLNWLFRGKGTMLNPIGAGDVSHQEEDPQPSLKVNDVHDNQVVFVGNWSELGNIMEKVITKALEGKK